MLKKTSLALVILLSATNLFAKSLNFRLPIVEKDKKESQVIQTKKESNWGARETLFNLTLISVTAIAAGSASYVAPGHGVLLGLFTALGTLEGCSGHSSRTVFLATLSAIYLGSGSWKGAAAYGLSVLAGYLVGGLSKNFKEADDAALNKQSTT